jgi:branched-chain amino acid transport system substrate-binding protein
MRFLMRLMGGLAVFFITSCAEEQDVRGVTDTEILIGSHLDLSGPASSIGVQVRNATLMAIDEVNEAGGIHGRQLRIIFEDNGYDPKKAVLASNKLISRDKVFMMLHVLGTPVVLATMDKVLAAEMPHLFPFTGAIQTYEPFHRLKFAAFTPYYQQTSIITKELAREQGIKKFGILYQDDDFGLNVLEGVDLALEELGLAPVVKTTYKRGSTDFNTQIARLRAEGVEAVALATIVRETAGAVKAARDLGWDVPFYCTTACYTRETVEVGGRAVEGLLAAGQIEVPYEDDTNPAIAAWVAQYIETFGLAPSSLALGAYINTMLLAEALQLAGVDLNVGSLVKALEDLPPYVHPEFGGVPIDFDSQTRLGADTIFIAQVEDGRWVTRSEILSMK